QARAIRTQLEKRADIRIVAQFAEAPLAESDLRDRAKLERLEARVMAEVARRHAELGQAAAEYFQDSEHGTWELRYVAGQHGIRRHTLINADLVRSFEFNELKRAIAELKSKLVEPFKLVPEGGEPQEVTGWDEIATKIEE